MATIYDKLDDKMIDFINEQHMFFVSTASKKGRINLSPKGLDSLRILNPNQVAYVNFAGSGNETSAHLLEDNRMTMMFCSFSRKTNIMRLYGTAREIIPEDEEFADLAKTLPDIIAIRQIYILDIEGIQLSCGYGVPIMDHVGDRETLEKYWSNKGPDGLADYIQENNLTTIDGLRTRQPITK